MTGYLLDLMRRWRGGRGACAALVALLATFADPAAADECEGFRVLLEAERASESFPILADPPALELAFNRVIDSKPADSRLSREAARVLLAAGAAAKANAEVLERIPRRERTMVHRRAVAWAYVTFVEFGYFALCVR